MKTFWIASLCVLLFSSAVAAQQNDAAPTAPQSRAKPTEQKLAPADFSQEPFVIEKYSTIARFENDGTGERDLTARIRVQSDAGVQQLGELIFGYNSAN